MRVGVGKGEGEEGKSAEIVDKTPRDGYTEKPQSGSCESGIVETQ